MSADILIVDDEADIRELIAGILMDEGFETRLAHNSDAALSELSLRRPTLVILDIWLQGSRMDGLDLLLEIKQRAPELPVVIISGHGNIETAVAAIKRGAYEYIEKPFNADRLLLVVGRALEVFRLKRENEELKGRSGLDNELIGSSLASRTLKQLVKKIAPSNSRVLISGPMGSGKELVARTLHSLSRRRSGPFVEVNCAAIPEELIESELFGHVRGAFTGAVADKPGRFEQATTGTIFLDEIADMSLKTQAKVLRVLQEQVMERVGGTQRIKVDVRVLVDQQGSAERDPRRPLPRRPLLPAQRDPDFRAVVARSATGHSAARRTFHGAAGGRIRPPPEAARARGGGAAAAIRLAR